MAEIDLSVYKRLGDLVSNGMDAFSKGYDINMQGQKDQNALRQFEQTYNQTHLSNLLDNQKKELANASDKLSLDQAKRKYEYTLWDSKYEMPTINGAPDFKTYLKDATAAGFGDLAKSTMTSMSDNLNQQMKDQAGQRETLVPQLKQLALGVQGRSPQEKQAISEEVSTNILNQTGVDIKQIFGKDWINTLVTSTQTPQQLRETAQSYDTPEGRNAKSTVSTRLRDQVNKLGGNVPDGVSAFELMSNPMYKTLVDQIPTETRVAALGQVAGANASKDRIDELRTRISDIAKVNSIRPVDFVLQKIGSLTNQEEAARLNQLVADLKAEGIEVTPSTNFSGVMDSLNSKYNQLTSTQQGQRVISQSKTLPTAQQEPPLAPKRYKITNKTTGATMDFDEQQLKILKSHKNSNNFTIEAQ